MQTAARARKHEPTSMCPNVRMRRGTRGRALHVRQDEMAPRCEMFMYMMHMWVVYALLDWVQVRITAQPPTLHTPHTHTTSHTTLQGPQHT